MRPNFCGGLFVSTLPRYSGTSFRPRLRVSSETPFMSSGPLTLSISQSSSLSDPLISLYIGRFQCKPPLCASELPSRYWDTSCYEHISSINLLFSSSHPRPLISRDFLKRWSACLVRLSPPFPPHHVAISPWHTPHPVLNSE